jgi:hypothetical protein
MRKRLFCGAAVVMVMLSGCTIYEKYTLEPLGASYDVNRSLPKMPEADFQLMHSKAKGECKVEAYKLQIPSPSCSTIPAPSCDGLSGFALGFCRGQQPYQTCDYSSVNAAKEAQSEIFKNCMVVKGWSTEWVKGEGANTSGGVFEKIASTNDGVSDFYLKPDSIVTDGNYIKAIIRSVNKSNPMKSYQGYWVYSKKENWFRVDEGPKTQVPPDSAAKLILNRINELD